MLYTDYSMGKNIFCSRSATSPYLWPKCAHEIFFRINLHPEGLIFEYFFISKMDSQT